MPRKKQKSGPAPRANRPGAGVNGGGPAKNGSGPASQHVKNKKTVASNAASGASQDGTGGAGQKKQSLQANQRPIVPFLKGDRILLVGEGDFSFARSLAKQYKCRKLCATCYDSKETLFSKYPQAEQHIQEILNSASLKRKSTEDAALDNEESTSSPATKDEADKSHQQTASSSRKPSPKVLFSVDARKLGTPAGGSKEVRTGFPRKERKIPAWKLARQMNAQSQLHSRAKVRFTHGAQATPGKGESSAGGPWDVICFNFPHVGGLSTDVNRQVRANQELLVAFFKACVPLLSKAPPPVDEDDLEEDGDGESDASELSDSDDGADDEEKRATSGNAVRTGPGQILVSLFEGEPYTLWNVKDLARHAGLQVVTSFRFPWAEYEGYSHARTLGEVEGKDGGRGGWRGEDRLARMYVFEVKPEEKPAKNQKNKRSWEGDSDSE
ncbi:hypothetical protein N7539_009465 [Penicillium diatomitis]|uniref:25S rRNA (uridine-N(3))-methyltransferase BMT5-like domain-containing protein n=1 Tax=Penicillium diatomitis TaxID=2819901 RepID=A0A9X0BJF6_9EURO|nr:uncharacterized protein N7539_009465 [Penicillium diatomitis]KAJ5466736.1 hypothetical protein N7539_009465 [Penicillium diatomitis]